MSTTSSEEFPVTELCNSLTKLSEVLNDAEIQDILTNLLADKELNEVFASPFPMDLLTSLVKSMPETNNRAIADITDKIRTVFSNIPASKKKGVIIV
jgi:hypothetical protein